MRKKIIAISIVGIIVLIGLTSLSVNGMKTNNDDTNQDDKLGSYVGEFFVEIDMNPNIARADVHLFLSGLLSGSCDAGYQVWFFTPDPDYKVVAHVRGQIWIFRRTLGLSYELLNINEDYEFTDDNVPSNINIIETTNVNTNLYDTTGHITLTVEVWRWDTDQNKWLLEDTFQKGDEDELSRNKIINNQSFNLLMNNPNLFPLLQRLLGI